MAGQRERKERERADKMAKAMLTGSDYTFKLIRGLEIMDAELLAVPSSLSGFSLIAYLQQKVFKAQVGKCTSNSRHLAAFSFGLESSRQ